MDGRKSSKKPRSYGGASRSSRSSQNPRASPSLAVRPQYKERVKSAPLGVPQIEQQLQQGTEQETSEGKIRRKSQTSESGSRLLGPLPASLSNESAVHIQPYDNSGYVKMS